MSMRLRPRQPVLDSGQALVEYALILALASLGIVSALMILQGSLGNSMQASSHQIDAATGGAAGSQLSGQPAGGETGAARPATGGEDDGDGTGGPAGHGNGKGNSGNGNGNGGPNGRR
jgi:Flp pilus assembly pilin Flp